MSGLLEIARRARTIIVALALAFVAAPAASAQGVIDETPARLAGASGCLPGSFLDVGLGQCWSCPTAAPNRTVFPVDGPNACEAPAREVFNKASGPKSPTGLLKTDCPRGYFLDIGKGQCYTCNGANRSAYPVTHARACSKVVPAVRMSAKLESKSPFCPEGSFQHGLTNRCYTCPEDYVRNLRIGDDPAAFNACTLTEAGKAKRLGMEVGERLAPQMIDAMLASLSASNDPDTRAKLESRDASVAATASGKPGANPCVLDMFKAWSLGAGADVKAVGGLAGDTGMSVDIRKDAREGRTPQRNAYWYAAGAWSLGPQAGASAGVNYGCWLADNNAILGDYQGITFDPFEFASMKAAMKAGTSLQHVKDAFKTSGASVSFGVWFDKDWNFTGVTMTPAYGRGLSFGNYSKGTTVQLP